MRKAATKRGGSQARAKATKGSKSVGTKKTIKAAPRQGGLNTIKISAKLMKGLNKAAQAAGCSKVEKFVTPHLEKLANT